MKHARVLLVSLALASCSVSSNNPVQSVPGEPVDPAALFGIWELVELVDENLELGSRVEVSARSQGELVLALGSETEPLTRLAVLTEIGSQLVLSVQNKASWYILGLDLDEGGQRLVVHALSLEMVQQAVETGALHGDTAEFSFDQQVIELTESSTGLADFLLENPQHFQTQVAVLEKAGEGE